MNKIYLGFTDHIRFLPRLHKFKYPTCFYSFDIDLLEEGRFNSVLFGTNKFSLISIYHNDYLYNDSKLSFRDKLLDIYTQHGLSILPNKIYLITMPRLLGYIFNPVSFFIGYDQNNNFHSMVCNVSNTFGERHLYLLSKSEDSYIGNSDDCIAKFRFNKNFYVSPFFNDSGEYELELNSLSDKLLIKISLFDSGTLLLSAALSGVALKLDNIGILRSFFKFSYNSIMVLTWIQYQALVLFFKRSIKAFPKPFPISQFTVKLQGSFFTRLRLAIISRFMLR